MAVYQVQPKDGGKAFGNVTLQSAAASGAGAGDTYSLPCMMSLLTWAVSYSGSPDGVSVTLGGSIDGVNFFTLDTTTNTAGEIRTLSTKAVNHIRSHVGTLSGGSSPMATVTAAGMRC